MLLQDKTAVITGGSEGIGFGIASVFIEEGADVMIIGRSQEKLDKAYDLLNRNGRAIYTYSTDLANTDNITTVCKELTDQISSLDILVNNAGMAMFKSFESVSAALLDQHINLNIKTPYFLTQGLLPFLKISEGNIINISSYFSNRMLTNRPSTAYSLTKGAIDSFTKALAFELGPKGIRVNAIAPGTIDTPLVRSNLMKLDKRQYQQFSDSIKSIYPLGTLGKPEDIAHAAAYLASDYARWVTGSIFNIDGGLTTN